MNCMRFTKSLLAGLLLTGLLAIAPDKSFAHGGAAVTLEGVEEAPTLEGFMLALPATDSRGADAVTLGGIMEPVGTAMGTVGITGITDRSITNHLIMGSMILMAMFTRTMTMTAPSMRNLLRAR